MFYKKSIKKLTIILGVIVLSAGNNIQANNVQRLENEKILDKNITYQLSQNNIDNQNDEKAKNKSPLSNGIDLSASDFVSAYDKNSKKLLGIDVEDKKGNEVGVVHDFLLKNNTISHAVVLVNKQSAVLADTIQKKFIAVPFNNLRIDDKSELSKAELQVKLNITKQQAEEMTDFQFNSNKVYSQTHDGNVADTAQVDYDFSVKNLIGVKVFGKNETLLGEVEDLVISNNKAKFAVILASGILGISDKLVAAPFQMLKINKGEEKIILDITSQDIEDAPEFQIRKP